MAFTPNNDEDLSERQIGFRLWIINHYQGIKRAITVVLIGISAIFWGYTIYGILDFWLITGPKEQQALAELSSALVNPEAVTVNRAEDLIVGEPEVFGESGKYDLAVKIGNPNAKWYVEFDYQFSGLSAEQPVRYGFALPGEEKYLISLALQEQSRPVGVAITFKNVKWHRINAHEIPDYEKWGTDHLNFKISDKDFAISGDKLTFNQLNFKIRNMTAYSYYNVDVGILLFRGSNLQGVNFISLDRFIAGEERDVSLQWKDGTLSPTEVQIQPSVNIFDPAVYMAPR